MEGQDFITINPDTLTDSTVWSYRDLQKISRAVGVKANGSRDDLVQKLQTWNRMRVDGTKTVVDDNFIDSQVPVKTENLEMNVIGNNFSILAVHVKAVDSSTVKLSRPACIDNDNGSSPYHKVKKVNKALFKFKNKRRSSRRSIIGFFNKIEPDQKNKRTSICGPGSISPSFLRPLRPAPATPGKSCLKKMSKYNDGEDVQNKEYDSFNVIVHNNDSKIERSPLTDLYEDQNNLNHTYNGIHATQSSISKVVPNTIIAPNVENNHFSHCYSTIKNSITSFVTFGSPQFAHHPSTNSSSVLKTENSPLVTTTVSSIASISNNHPHHHLLQQSAITQHESNNNNNNTTNHVLSVTKKARMSISFSPFNAVRIIAHRIEESSEECSVEEDDDYDDEDDDDNDLIASYARDENDNSDDDDDEHNDGLYYRM